MARPLAPRAVPAHDLERAWPELLAPGDPWAGDEHLADPAPYEDFLRHGGALDEPAFREADDAFLAAYRAILEGRAPPDAADAPARLLLVDGPRRHDRRAPARTAEPAGDDALADVAEDLVPDVGLLAERVLGPWADEPTPRPLRVAAGAFAAFIPLLFPAVRPAARADRPRSGLPASLRRTLRAAGAAPAMIWSVEAGDRPRPLLPLAPGWCPERLIADPGCPVFVARLVPAAADGAAWPATLLPLAAAPDPEVLLRRLDLEYRRARRHDRRLTWEDLLRDRAEVLARTAAEWAWAHDHAATRALWAGWRAPAPP